MRLITLTGLALLLATGYAVAAEGAVLDEAACQAAWSEAAGGDKDLSADKANPEEGLRCRLDRVHGT